MSFICIKNLPFDVDLLEIGSIFSKFGNILEMIILKPSVGQGVCAFVRYRTRTHAEAAVGCENLKLSEQSLEVEFITEKSMDFYGAQSDS